MFFSLTETSYTHSCDCHAPDCRNVAWCNFSLFFLRQTIDIGAHAHAKPADYVYVIESKEN